jgi:lipopolysaccharide/colanic/teichoic acid biosynthesis glycosyltransferase
VKELKVINGRRLVIANSRNKPVYFFMKQSIDSFFSLCSLIILFPLLITVAIFIKLDSPGPIFYKQERIGLSGKPFFILKFRSMKIDAEKNGPQWANQNDSRITRVGYYLRKYRIDEIPQFLNVLRGEISKRLQVKPGITGWAQINGGYEIDPKEKLELDLYYIYNFSILLDCKIILKSIPVILFAKGWR